MITTVLALFTLAASLGEEPPQILSANIDNTKKEGSGE